MRKQMIGIALILCGIWAALLFRWEIFQGAPLALLFSFLAGLCLPVIGLIWVIVCAIKE